MRRKCKFFIVVGGIVGTTLLCSEIAGVSPWASGPDERDVGLTPQVMVVKPVSTPTPIPAELMENWAARIAARPLFAPARRPASPPAAPAGKPASPPRLSGVMSWPGGDYAIFQPDKEAHPIVAGEGTVLGEWTVRTITKGRVVVSRGDERLVLHPTFADASVAETPVPRQLEVRARDQWGRHIRPPDYLERRRQEG